MKKVTSKSHCSYTKPVHISAFDIDAYNRLLQAEDEDDDMNTSLEVFGEHIAVRSMKKENALLVPGVYQVMKNRYDGIYLSEYELNSKKLLPSVGATEIVKKEVDQFITGIPLYLKRGLPAKRNLLFYSPPGQGKTTAIRAALSSYLDGHTLVINWEGLDPHPADLKQFLHNNCDFDPSIKRAFILMEDVNGAANQEVNNAYLSSFLNFLDGNGAGMKVPTMIIATTNFPEELVESVGNRPGRFDVIREMPRMSKNERRHFLEFYAKDLEGNYMVEVNDDVLHNKYNSLSLGHLEEAVNRAIIENRPLIDTMEDMRNHDERFKKNFTNKKKLGFNED